jgi:small-conductance mechanosensitive channel
LQPDPDVERIALEWPEFRLELSQLKVETADALDLETSESVLAELSRRWQIDQEQLQDWQEDLSRRIEELNLEVEILSSARLRWEATRVKASRDSLPETIIAQIDSVISVTDRTLPPLREARDRVLDLQSRITYENVEAQGTLDHINSLRSRQITDRFSRRQTPIWKLFSEESLAAGMGQEYRLISGLATTITYLKSQTGPLVLQILIILILAFAFGPLRTRLTELEQESSTVRVPVGVFKYPVLPAILFGLLATPLIYPAIPASLVAWTTILSVPLTVILLLQTTREAVRGLILGLGAIVILFILIRIAIPVGGVLERMAMFFLAIAIAVSGFRFLFTGKARFALGQTGFGRILLIIGRIGFALAGIAIIADVLGYASAADHTIRAMMIGLYDGLYIFVGAQIVNGGMMAFVRTDFAGRLRAIRNHPGDITAFTVRWVNIAAFVYWVYVSLGLLGVFGPVWEATSDVLNTPWGIGEFQLSFIDFVAFFVTLWVSIKVSQIIRILLDEDVLGRMQLARGLSAAVSSLTFYALVALGFLFALSAAGVPLDRVALITGALGIGIGFGLQDVVRNFISGLILMLERPIKVGDAIEVGSQVGTVTKIGIRSSIIRVWEGADVIVPNGHLVTNQVKNWTMADNSRRIDVNLTVDYDADPDQVSKILLDIGKGFDGVAQDPAPAVVFLGFMDRGMGFSLRCWVHDPAGWIQKRNELSAQAHKRLREAGIKFPAFPANA